VEANIARCPDPLTAERMIERIDEIRRTGNSVGGALRRRTLFFGWYKGASLHPQGLAID